MPHYAFIHNDDTIEEISNEVALEMILSDNLHCEGVDITSSIFAQAIQIEFDEFGTHQQLKLIKHNRGFISKIRKDKPFLTKLLSKDLNSFRLLTPSFTTESIMYLLKYEVDNVQKRYQRYAHNNKRNINNSPFTRTLIDNFVEVLSDINRELYSSDDYETINLTWPTYNVTTIMRIALYEYILNPRSIELRDEIIKIASYPGTAFNTSLLGSIMFVFSDEDKMLETLGSDGIHIIESIYTINLNRSDIPRSQSIREVFTMLERSEYTSKRKYIFENSKFIFSEYKQYLITTQTI